MKILLDENIDVVLKSFFLQMLSRYWLLMICDGMA